MSSTGVVLPHADSSDSSDSSTTYVPLYVPAKIPQPLVDMFAAENAEEEFQEDYHAFQSLLFWERMDTEFRDKLLFGDNRLGDVFRWLKQNMRTQPVPGYPITVDHYKIFDGMEMRCAFELMLYGTMKKYESRFDDTSKEKIWSMISMGLQHTLVYCMACGPYDIVIKVRGKRIMTKIEELHLQQ